MQRRRILLAGVALGAVLGAGGGFVSAATAADTTVHIDNFSFSPAQITVPAGTEVIWENRDDIPHTIVDAGDTRHFKSAALDTGDSFSYVFAALGTFEYFCSLHPHMRGTVVVT